MFYLKKRLQALLNRRMNINLSPALKVVAEKWNSVVVLFNIKVKNLPFYYNKKIYKYNNNPT